MTWTLPHPTSARQSIMHFDYRRAFQQIRCLGVRRETVTRGMAEFRYRSLISTKGPTILIRNRKALEAMIA
jgi:CRP-like cAMP-binding protein